MPYRSVPCSSPSLALLILLVAVVTTTLAPPATADPPAEPVRMAAEAFGQPMEIEVRGLPQDQARTAIEAAMEEILEIEDLARVNGDAEHGIARLNGAARDEAVALDPRILALLSRARDFCIWSRGAHGPLGGRLYKLWGLHDTSGAPRGLPRGAGLAEAVASAQCNRLALDPAAGTATLAAGSSVDLWGFAQGYAVDRALAVLSDRGCANAWVEVGWVRRGVGDGPSGYGWLLTLPVVEGYTQPLDEVWIRDRAVALTRADEEPLVIGGDLYPPFIDQNSGQPSEGVQAVIASSELAVDAQGLATAMMILGNRRGQALLGGLRPLPSVLWMLGDGNGSPLLAAYQWSKLKTR
jgi:thiamine biosynthesis lipoprotein